MKYIRRGIWFLAGRLLLICLLLSIAVTVFYYAMNLSNLQVILKDGMASRAKVIMGIETDATVLRRYFQDAYLATDQDLQTVGSAGAPYADYNVRGIDHRLEMGFVWTWPWDSNIRLTITESIPRIDGRVKGTRAEEVIAQRGAKAVYPPAWPTAQYRVGVVKENGQWKIRTLTRIGE